jgi:predicted RNA-binding Zn ribbon-like protein
MKLSDTQRAILLAAAQHPEHLAHPPERLPAGAKQKVAQALLKNDLVIGVHRPAYNAIAKWTVDGDEMLLKITDDGLRAIGIDPNAGDAPEEDEQSAAAEAAAPVADTAPTGGEDAAEADAPAEEAEPTQAAPTAPAASGRAEDLALLDAALATPASRVSLRDAAQRVLDAWDDEANQRYDLTDAMDALRQILAKPARATREPGAPRKQREGTKQETVLAMLRREEGATIAQICEATGWQQHTVRGFFAGLKKRQGIEVKVLERIRQVGPNKEGAKGSYSIYRIAD